MKNLPKPDLSNLTYDPETGIISRITSSPYAKAGPILGRPDSQGYILIRVGGRKVSKYKAHRLAFWLMGEDPTGWQVDHINGIKNDNRWCNLRLVDQYTNALNQKAHREKKVKYYSFDRNAKKWRVLNTVNGKRKNYGYFKTEQEAIDCAKANGLYDDL